MQWEVQAFVDGPKINITGTVEHVHSQLLKANPNYDVDFASFREHPAVDTRSVEKRFGPVCGGGGYNWQPADWPHILSNIDYLRTVPGKPTMGPGPGKCARVSCSYNDAVWWCNDNTNTFSLPSFSTIADCAQVLVDRCLGALGSTGEVVGQNFVSVALLPGC